MNTIISLHTPDIAEHARVFTETHKRYSDRWGYSYECATEKLWPELHASFSKVPLIEKKMNENFDLIIWLDSDIGITNATVDLGDILRSRPDHFMSGYKQGRWESWDYICDGLLILRNGPDLRRYMDQWIDRCLNGCPLIIPGKRTKMQDVPFEQWHSDGLNREWNFKGIYPAKPEEVGCFSKEIWHDDRFWKRGYPTVHCGGAGATWDRRAKVFRDVYAPQSIW